MITFAVERFSAVYDEMRPLLVEHYDELSAHKAQGISLDPQVNVYFERERAGNQLTIIARESGAIVGYFLAFIAPGLHYASCLTCSPDIFFVRTTHRHSRIAADMFSFVENELHRRGVCAWMVGSKHAHDVTKLFEYMGFSPFEITYIKWLEK